MNESATSGASQNISGENGQAGQGGQSGDRGQTAANGQTGLTPEGSGPDNALDAFASGQPQKTGQGEAAARADGGPESGKADGAAEGKSGDGAGDGANEQADAAWNEFVASVSPDLGIAPETLRDFAGLARETGLKPEAAAKLMDWAHKAGLKAREAMASKGREYLAGIWGADMERNLEQATAVVAMLDRQLGDNRFKNALERSGVCADPDFAMGLKHIADRLGEDMLSERGSAASRREETALDGMRQFFK